MYKIKGELGVDAGLISLMSVENDDIFDQVDMNAVAENGEILRDVDAGVYDVEMKIKNTWNGDVGVSSTIEVEHNNSTLYFGDPCYITKDDLWCKEGSVIIDETVQIVDNKGIVTCEDMGGDGCYLSEVKLIPKK